MKKSHLAVLLFILIAAVACAPNRLKSSLTESEGSQAQQSGPPAAPAPDGRSLQPQLGNAEIDLNEVVALLPPDAIPAVLPDEVPGLMVTAEEAENIGIDPNTRVLGIEVEGDARAYPVPFMSGHEIVNDEVGGRPVAVTW